VNRSLMLKPILALLAIALFAGAELPTAAEEDLLPVDSQWKGTLTQRAKTPDNIFFPPEFDATLTIVKREGNDFEAELREHTEGLDITFLVRGKLLRGADKSYSIDFKSYDVKALPNAAIYYLNVPYTARISEGGLKGTWSYEQKDSGVALAGEFKLKRADD